MFCRALSHGRHLSLLESLPVLAQHVQGSHSTAQRGYAVARIFITPPSYVFGGSYGVVDSANAKEKIFQHIYVLIKAWPDVPSIESVAQALCQHMHNETLERLPRGAEFIPLVPRRSMSASLYDVGWEPPPGLFSVSWIGTLRKFLLTVPRAKGQNFETGTLERKEGSRLRECSQ